MALANISWKGMKAVEKMLDVLPEKLGGQKLRQAYRFALKPTLSKMREAIPKNRTKALWYATDTTIGGTKDINEMFAIVGPRRRKNTWNMKGFHAHMIEKGTKRHTITAGRGKKMPIFRKGSSGPVAWAKSIEHPGSKAFKPFQPSIDSTFGTVAIRVSDKVAEIMRSEIKSINSQYGQAVTKSEI